MELPLDEGPPVNVLPVHTPERVAETGQRLRQRQGTASFTRAPLGPVPPDPMRSDPSQACTAWRGRSAGCGWWTRTSRLNPSPSART